MESYLNNIETIENNKYTPEQRLWRAVIVQVMYDILSDYDNNYRDKGDESLALAWVQSKHKDFVDVCRNAGFDPDYLYKKIHNLISLKKLKKIGIVWNYKRKENNEYKQNNLSKMQG